LNFVELGTRYQKPQPWIRKSLLQARDEAELALANSILLGIDNAVKSA
jgi:hypothetical protein